ncbi:hydantoinase B/oxoprolinase family protein [Haloterrigena alkaliphila]|uniref:hydantoinase B/oxoprolinase family protein n=1 Tax=Haloterrigena alkaliphila TaxID=2816475 RepID=UPI001CFFB306|nr:hydantoinase B/oxoprolinase family protein [Haloterrigena alkaliphila]UHQ95216.1 hydantoinase B/oxoprolinase family protein [Haloterrigena alkaliphila]
MSDSQHTGSDIWEDFTSGYVPDEELDVHPSLSLHAKANDDIDPVTHEVLRHRLYSINEEHGQTLENVSGSPVAYYAQDFNPTILAEDGEVIFQGPYIQFFSPIAELQVKWILENRSDNPGIEPGDVFLANDPWIGATHQPDVHFIAPVFEDGELFAWVVNTLHQYDIGGIDPGSFCPGADDVFHEPSPIPPIKIVEGGERREDLRQLYLRQSRLPQMVGLDFNAQLAGVNVARDRLTEVVDEYGASTVKGVMRDVLDDAERSFTEKLETIPDGTWRARGYMDGSQTGDTDLYVGQVQLTKEGDTLTFTNEGTEDEAGAMNLTYAGFRTAIMSVLNPMMMYDAMWVAGGALRHIDIETTPGTFTHAEWPSAVSTGGQIGIEFAICLINDVVARMLASSDEHKRDIINGTHESSGAVAQAGIDQWGDEFGTMNLDCMGLGGVGASPHKDGIDTGGAYWAPKAPIPNMEHNEQDYPILYLYRDEVPDSGGAGEFRGGVGMHYCWIPHNTSQIENVLAGVGGAVPLSRGVSGEPGATLRPRIVRDSDIESRLEAGEIPERATDAEGAVAKLPSKSYDTQEPDDIWEVRTAGSPGYGDPLERDPEDVAEDVRNGYVSESVAADTYGVVLTEAGGRIVSDLDATADRRDELRDERLANSTIPAEN